MKGRLDGLAMRVPTPNVSLIDLVATVEKIHLRGRGEPGLVAAAQEGALKGVLQPCATEPLVSIDYQRLPLLRERWTRNSTNVMGGNLVKVMAWYDNEMGFSHAHAGYLAGISVGASVLGA